MGWGFELGLLAAVLVAIWLAVWALSKLVKKRKRNEYFDKLQALAQQAGGRVSTDEHESTPRSTALLPAFSGREGGLDALTTTRPPRYDHAMSLWRGRWFVRAAQASRVVAAVSGPGNSTTSYSYRIEVEVAACPALKISPIVDYGTRRNGQHVPDRMLVREDELQHPPQGSSVGHWSQVSLPGNYAERFHVFADDHQFAAEVLNEASLEWLAEYITQVRGVWAIENGLLYVNRLSQHIEPDTIVPQIDAIVGFLDRTPIQPGDPSGRGSQQGRAQA